MTDGRPRAAWLRFQPFVTRIGALIFGSAPAVALPVVSALTLSSSRSDELLFAISISLTMTVISTGAAEAGVLGAIGAVRALVPLSKTETLRLAGLATTRSMVALPVVFSLSVGIFATSASSKDLMWRALQDFWPVLAVPIIALPAAAFSAYLISRGHIAIVLASSGARSIPILLGLVVRLDTALLVAAVVCGELLRTCLLMVLALNFSPAENSGAFRVIPKQLQYRSMVIQVLWVMTNQIGVSLLRAVFASGPAGSFTAGETALRIQNVASQIAISGFTMPLVAKIPKDFQAITGREAVLKANRVMLRCLMGGAAVSLIVGASAVCFAFIGTDRSDLQLGAVLGLIIVASCGPVAASTWASRAVVFTSANGILLVIGIAVCLLLAAVFFVITLWVPEPVIPSVVAYVVITAVAGWVYASIARARLSKRQDLV